MNDRVHDERQQETKSSDTAPPGTVWDGTVEMSSPVPTLPDFEITAELGRGAMGVVYEALQIRLNRRVAVKMIAPTLDAGHRGRFRTEAEAVAQLQHPNIVQVFDCGEHDGRPFLVLELVEGHGLDHAVANGPLPPRQAAETVVKLARAMQLAHDKGIVHRDLKPSNVLVDAKGEPKVTDFGLAKQLAADSGQTQAGQIMGTPSYMSPEQAAGRNAEVGPLADVYSLGAILYDLLTGLPPFDGETVVETLDRVRHRSPQPPRQLEPRVHRDLETICLRCLEKEPRSRYGSAAALADDLERFLNGEAIHARPISRVESVVRYVRRRPRDFALAFAAVLAVVLGVAAAVRSTWNDEQVRERIAEQARELDVNRPVLVKSPLGLPVVAVPADNPLTAGKVALGRLLYFDTRLSVNGTVSCATCHEPVKGWADGLPLSEGVGGQLAARNAPTVVNASQHPRLFWDGRADKLETQTLGPLLNPKEMGMTPGRVVEVLGGIDGYRTRFDEVFEDGLTFENVGRAIAAYERTLVAGDSPFDRFTAGESGALSPAAERGRRLFFGKAHCSACHVGPNLTDQAFHNVGVGVDEQGVPRDEGRRSEGRLDGDHGAFRTPPLRDLHRTAPYMHDGSLATLAEVVEHYDRGGTPNAWLDEEIFPLDLTDDEKRDLVAFLREGLASGTYPFDKVEADEFPE